MSILDHLNIQHNFKKALKFKITQCLLPQMSSGRVRNGCEGQWHRSKALLLPHRPRLQPPTPRHSTVPIDIVRGWRSPQIVNTNSAAVARCWMKFPSDLLSARDRSGIA